MAKFALLMFALVLLYEQPPACLASLNNEKDTTSGKYSYSNEEGTIKATTFSGESTTFYCCHHFTSKTIWVIDGKNYSNDELPPGYHYVEEDYPGIEIEPKYTKNSNSALECRSKDNVEPFNLSDTKCLRSLPDEKKEIYFLHQLFEFQHDSFTIAWSLDDNCPEERVRFFLIENNTLNCLVKITPVEGTKAALQSKDCIYEIKGYYDSSHCENVTSNEKIDVSIATNTVYRNVTEDDNETCFLTNNSIEFILPISPDSTQESIFCRCRFDCLDLDDTKYRVEYRNETEEICITNLNPSMNNTKIFFGNDLRYDIFQYHHSYHLIFEERIEDPNCSISVNFSCENSCPTVNCHNELYENCYIFVSDVEDNVTLEKSVALNCSQSIQLCDKECGKKYFYLIQCYNNDTLEQECDGHFSTVKDDGVLYKYISYGVGGLFSIIYFMILIIFAGFLYCYWKAVHHIAAVVFLLFICLGILVANPLWIYYVVQMEFSLQPRYLMFGTIGLSVILLILVILWILLGICIMKAANTKNVHLKD